jgi:hypothetical protein
MQNLYHKTSVNSQSDPQVDNPSQLAAPDRRLYLDACLGVLLKKLRHGREVHAEELTSLVPYADDGCGVA